MRRRKSNYNRIVFIFIISILFLSTSYSIFSTSLSIEGKGNMVEQPVKQDYTITYTKDSWYSGGMHYYNFKMKVSNNTNKNLTSWIITVDIPDDIITTTCWSSICLVNNGNLTIENESYNSTILSNSYIEFGFSFSTSIAEVELETYKIYVNGSEPDPEDPDPEDPDPEDPDPEDPDPEDPDPELPTYPSNLEGLNVTITYGNGWQSGSKYIKQYDIKIENNSNKNIKSWEFGIDLKGTIALESCWNATTFVENNILKVSNVSYNGNLNIGSNLTFGMQLSSTQVDFTPTIVYYTGK